MDRDGAPLGKPVSRGAQKSEREGSVPPRGGVQDPFDVFAESSLFNVGAPTWDKREEPSKHNGEDRPAKSASRDDPRWEAVRNLEDPAVWARVGVREGYELIEWFACGFDAAEAGVWREALLRTSSSSARWHGDLGGLAHTARVWLVAGFRVGEVGAWCEALASEDPLLAVQEARRWRAAGFTPQDASWWRSTEQGFTGHDLEFAARFASADWNPFYAALLRYFLSRLDLTDADETVRRYLALNLSIVKTLNYAKAGVDPAQVGTLEDASLSEYEQEMELRERGSRLPDFDPFSAMWINHLVFHPAGEMLGIREYFEEQVARDPLVERQGATYSDGRPFRDSYWGHRKILAERRRLEERQRRLDDRCEGSDRHGLIEDIPGRDDQYVICSFCGLTTMGGSSVMAPHTKSKPHEWL